MFSLDLLISLGTLTLMEIVLGIDNLIFISILVAKLPLDKQQNARIMGLSLALICRIGLLFMVSYLVHLTKPLVTLFDHPISIKDLILITGGIFLIYKSVKEIYIKVEKGEEDEHGHKPIKSAYSSIISQIVLIDIVFSIDSIITAVGLVDNVYIMIIAVVISMIVMLIFAKPISNFVNDNPSIKILALSFLIMIGTMLVGEGFHAHFPKGYIYFSITFALVLEVINMRMRKKQA